MGYNMEINNYAYYDKNLSISESFNESKLGYVKKASNLCERRFFESTSMESEKSYEPKKSSKNNFKHLVVKDSNSNSEYSETPEEKNVRRHLHGRSPTNTIKVSPSLQEIDGKKKPKLKKLALSTEGFRLNGNRLFFSEQELNNPTSARDFSNGFKSIKIIKSLDQLKPIDESKELGFNEKFRKKLKKYLDGHEPESTILHSVTELDKMAQDFFDKEILKDSKSNLNLKQTSSIDLVRSELPRAQSAIIKLQKSMILVEELIPRIEHLQDSIFKVLTKNKNKTSHSKTQWINDFFAGLDQMISSYKHAQDEVNPLKIFTCVVTEKVKDQKIMDFLMMVLTMKKAEFENLMSCLNKWSDFRMIYSLTPRVHEIDHLNIRKCLDCSPDHIVDQEHTWSESMNAKNSLFKMPIEEIVNAFSPEFLAFYKEIAINEEPIRLNGLTGTRKESQFQFLTNFLEAIYRAGFDPQIKRKECQNQATVLVNIGNICKNIESNLFEEEIPWNVVQKKLKDYPAIPFSKLKSSFILSKHMMDLDQFLIELAVPCSNVLRLTVNSCWQKADTCIHHLFTDLFECTTDIQTEAKPELICRLQIKNKELFSSVHIKQYETYSMANKSVDLANLTFKWNVNLQLDEINDNKYLKGLLTVQNVKIYDETSKEIKAKILKILNNPNIVDYVPNSLDGSPAIQTTFK